jgi:hypothetical protein
VGVINDGGGCDWNGSAVPTLRENFILSWYIQTAAYQFYVYTRGYQFYIHTRGYQFYIHTTAHTHEQAVPAQPEALPTGTNKAWLINWRCFCTASCFRFANTVNKGNSFSQKFQ